MGEKRMAVAEQVIHSILAVLGVPMDRDWWSEGRWATARGIVADTLETAELGGAGDLALNLWRKLHDDAGTPSGTSADAPGDADGSR